MCENISCFSVHYALCDVLQESCLHGSKECQHEARGGVKSRCPVAQILVIASTTSDLLAAVYVRDHQATFPYRGRIIF